MAAGKGRVDPGGAGRRSRLRCALLAGLVLLVAGQGASAQEIIGTVTEVGSDAPLSGALVTVLDVAEALRATALSDDEGRFLLRAPAGDSVQIRVQRVGFAELKTQPILLQPDDSLRLEIRMRPEAVQLEGVTVTGQRVRRDLAAFSHRRATGFGRYYGPDELAGRRNTTADMLIAGLGAGLLSGPGHGTIYAYRPPTNESEPFCTPAVYVDRVLLAPLVSRNPGDPVAVPISVSSSDILGIEVYRNPNQVPPEFQRPFMDCTTVLIWTNYAFGIGR